MENNYTNADYHKFVRVGDQKREIVEITIGIIFFWLRFVFTIFYTESFQVLPEKNYPHLECQFPPKISIWRKSLLYKCSEKWLSPPPPPPPIITLQGEEEGGVQTSIAFDHDLGYTCVPKWQKILSVELPISGTIHHMIVIYGTHV